MDAPERELAAVIAEAGRALRDDDTRRMRTILDEHPELKARIDEPLGPFESPAILHARSPAMLDLLLDAGADIDARSRWWAGGFGLLDSARPELAAHAIERGAVVDAHAAARLGMMDRLQELVATDPEVVHARGGDGQTPLHFACSTEVAAFLLEHGADIDARDVDHESTPAQWMLEDRQEVARYLVSRGCATDLLMATALGDVELVRRHLDEDPGCVRMRVSEEFFPIVGGDNGGTIYQWTLAFCASAHRLARERGHAEILALLRERTPPDLALIEACWDGDEETARALLATEPSLVGTLSEADRRHVAHAARDERPTTVRLMLECGWPVDATGVHRATPLHWAGFHGDIEMAAAILALDPPLEVRDGDFDGTPLRWAIYGSLHGWRACTGQYPQTVERLLRAGATPPAQIDGSAAVQEVLRRHGVGA